MYGVVIAFKDYNIIKGVSGSNWVGLKHFQKVWKSPTFWEVFHNTVEISGLRIIFGFPAPILLAILLNEINCKNYKKYVQTITYFPHFLRSLTVE